MWLNEGWASRPRRWDRAKIERIDCAHIVHVVGVVTPRGSQACAALRPGLSNLAPSGLRSRVTNGGRDTNGTGFAGRDTLSSGQIVLRSRARSKRCLFALVFARRPGRDTIEESQVPCPRSNQRRAVRTLRQCETGPREPATRRGRDSAPANGPPGSKKGICWWWDSVFT